ncbi:MAG: hypothetical protein IPL96_00230 [Holophagaceae bacterium]|nr:hypothetical protein [Holophagaceae bacterium]
MRPSRSLVLLSIFLVAGGLVAQVPAPPKPPRPPRTAVPEPPEPPAPPAPPEPPAPPIDSNWGETRTERRTERLSFGSKLWVKNRNGGIRVEGWEKEEVSLVAQIRDTEQRRVDLVLSRKGSDLDIEAVFPQVKTFGFFFGDIKSPRCEMTLSVPKRILGHFRTTNGSVTAQNLDGYARCEATNGAIKVFEVKGAVFAETTNGGIEARNLFARIKGGTTNGKIVLQDVLGGIQMETTNGGIVAKNLDGWGEGIKLETTNGGIEIELGKASGDLIAENSNGGLDIKVAGAEVIEIQKHNAHLKIPGKAQRIELETTNGGIKVK